MSTQPHEQSGSRPDTISSEQYVLARQTLERVCELEHSKVVDSLLLAQCLQGVSRAISSIVHEHGIVEALPRLRADGARPTSTPDFVDRLVFRHITGLAFARQKMFVVRSDRGFGTYMCVSTEEVGSSHKSHDVLVPNDRQIDNLLSVDTCLWENKVPHAQDYRDNQEGIFYPFHYELYTDVAPQRYLSILQELSATLLNATA